MEPSKVKKAFYKASLVIHPDKVSFEHACLLAARLLLLWLSQLLLAYVVPRQGALRAR